MSNLRAAASDTPDVAHPLYVLGWKAGYKHGAWQTQHCAQPADSGEPVAHVSECEACFTPDACQLRGTCDHYAAEKLRIAAAPQPAPARVPLTDAQKDVMWRVAYRENSTRFGSFDWYAQGVEDAERAHGIVDKG